MAGGPYDALAQGARPFERRGFVRRTVPLGLAAIVGLTVLMLAGHEQHRGLLAVSLAGFLAIWAIALLTPWARLPRSAEAVPPLLLLGLLVGLRSQLGAGLPAASLAPLFLIPMFWVALFGTTRELLLLIVLLAIARVGASVQRGDGAEIAQAVVAVIVSSTVCVLAQQVVARLRAAEQSLRIVLDRLPVGFAIVQRGQIAYVNDHVAKVLGHEPADLIGHEATSILHPDEVAAVNARSDSVLGHGEVRPSDRRFLHRGGGEVIQETSPMRLTIGGEPAIGVVVRDVTDERLLEAAEDLTKQRTANERAQLVAILDAVWDGVAILDHERRGIYANPAYLELFGLEARRLAGMTQERFIEHVAGLTSHPAETAMRIASLAASDESVFEFVRPRRRVMRRTIRPLQLPGGPGFIVVWHDVTADHDLAAEREQQALTDALTGLPNRRAAEAAIQREIARARRQQTPLTVALLDVDRFKGINDRFGHDVGDRVLVFVAGVLAAQARTTDTVARWGGEEFLAILPGDVGGAVAYCERVRAALASAPVADVGLVTLSGGVAAVADGHDPNEALRKADARLYFAKRSGRDRIASEITDEAPPSS